MCLLCLHSFYVRSCTHNLKCATLYCFFLTSHCKYIHIYIYLQLHHFIINFPWLLDIPLSWSTRIHLVIHQLMDNYDFRYYRNGYLHACSFGIFPRNGISKSKNIFMTLDIFTILLYNKVYKVSSKFWGFTKLAVNYEGMSFTVKLTIVSRADMRTALPGFGSQLCNLPFTSCVNLGFFKLPVPQLPSL